MINIIGHFVLNLTLLGGIFGCLYHVNPYLAYALVLHWVAAMHSTAAAKTIAAKIADAP